jgi:Ca2+-transporting ATPase
MEAGLMQQAPRPFTTTFFKFQELSTSIVQGLVITGGTLFIYQYAVAHGYSEHLTRTMVFITLVSANIFLTLVNRSFYHSIFTTLFYRNNLVPLIVAVTIGLMAVVLSLPLFRSLFEFETVSSGQIGISTAVGAICVLWFELVKMIRRLKEQ